MEDWSAQTQALGFDSLDGMVQRRVAKQTASDREVGRKIRAIGPEWQKMLPRCFWVLPLPLRELVFHYLQQSASQSCQEYLWQTTSTMGSQSILLELRVTWLGMPCRSMDRLRLAGISTILGFSTLPAWRVPSIGRLELIGASSVRLEEQSRV